LRLLISCGEPSGELYGSELVRHLRHGVAGLEVFGLGGDRLEAQGAGLVAHVRELAVVGLIEVVRHLRRFRQIFHELLDEVDRRRPDLAVLVDYPDFNLRLASELHRRRIPVIYYVSPQVWAWRPGRLRSMKTWVRHALVIFPFEEAVYRDAGIPVTFVGHPLVDLVRPAPDSRSFLESTGLRPERPLVGLLPGSRPQEVAHNLPPLEAAVSELARRRPDLQFVLAAAPSLDVAGLERRLRSSPVRVVPNAAHEVLSAATVAIVASGTATVEAALLGTPMVVVYRLSPLTYALGRPFVKVSRFAMANLIAGRSVVPELIQGDFTPTRVVAETSRLLDDPVLRDRMRSGLREVRERLGAPGASARAARAVLDIWSDLEKA
jgi:lipid-A-disaccharide synthase